jgi:hypothetical protein
MGGLRTFRARAGMPLPARSRGRPHQLGAPDWGTRASKHHSSATRTAMPKSTGRSRTVEYSMAQGRILFDKKLPFRKYIHNVMKRALEGGRVSWGSSSGRAALAAVGGFVSIEPSGAYTQLCPGPPVTRAFGK